ncbi:MAG: hypothetical protein M3389_15385, partial [Actinomycetota bacterium]|nr:hypothetical protein [Actinomycetota bacterium]
MIPGATAPRALLGALVALLLLAAPATAEEFGPTTAVPITASGTSSLPVSGLAGPITDVNVLLHDIDHDRGEDIDVVVESPTGQRLVLMSDACGPNPVVDLDLKFDDVATASLPAAPGCTDGLYDPTDHPPADAWSAMPFYTSLGDFNGEVANGTWSIEVIDDDTGSATGAINGGWSLEITTAGTPAITISTGSQAFGAATPFPAELDVLGLDRAVITDLDVLLNGVTHQRAKDVDMFVEGPGGQKAWLMSDACPVDHKLVVWTVDDEAPNAFSTGEVCSSGSYRAANYDGEPDGFPAPAPAPPGGTATSLSAFDLTDPDGTWRLWIADNGEGGQGFVHSGWDLQMTTRAPAHVGFPVAAQTVREGDTVTVDIVRDGSVAPLGAGSIVVATQSDTARASQDFTPISQTVTFAPGETTKSISVPVAADGPFEGEESFSIALGLAEGDAEPGTPAAVAVTIPADAQQPPPEFPTGNEDKPAPKAFRPTDALRSPSARRCRRRGSTIRFRLRMPDGVAITRSEVFVDNRKVEDNVGVAAIAPISLTLDRRTLRVRIRLTSHDGRVVTFRRTFRACARRGRPR